MRRAMRAAGRATEFFPDTRKVAKQLQNGSKKGFRIALIAGPDEFAAGKWQVKDLAKAEQHSVSESDLVSTISGILAQPA
jgi:histidyl-tRNA synthetase